LQWAALWCMHCRVDGGHLRTYLYRETLKLSHPLQIFPDSMGGHPEVITCIKPRLKARRQYSLSVLCAWTAIADVF
jgi:hypothetical protein